jgi:hypothetical protein
MEQLQNCILAGKKLTDNAGGGMPTSQNRTKWPINGGAVSLQPGWFPGHSLALFYINMGYGNEPLNFSHAMLPVFQITGPSNVQYNGSFCLPQVPLPANYTPKVGDNATIQVIETAQHGAALYNVCSSHTIPARDLRLTSGTIVRRYHIRRTPGCAGSERDQLLQLDTRGPEHRLPARVLDDVVLCLADHCRQRLLFNTRTLHACCGSVVNMAMITSFST